LDEAERTVFEAHLEQGCEACEAELSSLRGVADGLATVASIDPPPGLRQRLMAKVGSAPRSPGILFEESGLLISRSAELVWEPLAPGIQFKPLFMDSDRFYNTMLVRMDSGARYPGHRHHDVEELFVLSGDLHISGEVMRQGDYCRADTDTLHGETFSELGCLFLLMASQKNEIVT